MLGALEYGLLVHMYVMMYVCMHACVHYVVIYVFTGSTLVYEDRTLRMRYGSFRK